MNNLWEHILAMFLSIIPPGNNEQSRVPIIYCDESCQQTVICDDKTTWHCSAPKLDKNYFNKKVADFSKTMNKEEAEKLATPISFTRPETYEEGLVRYTIISKAIEKVSVELSRKKCLKEHADKSVCKGKPWMADEKSLAAFTATLILKESGLRSDVHGGLESGLGDCFHKYIDGKITRYCNSYGLGQVMQIAINAHNLPYKKEDIVGLDYQSTEKSVRAITHALIGAKGVCQFRHPKMDSYAGGFSLYGTGNNCKLKYLNARANVFWYILYSKKKVDDTALSTMNGKNYKYLYNLLINSKEQIKHFPATKFGKIDLNNFIVKN